MTKKCVQIAYLFTLFHFGALSQAPTSEAVSSAEIQERKFSVALDLSGIVVGEYSLRGQYKLNSFMYLTLPIDLTFKSASLLPTEVSDFIRVFGFGLYPDFSATGGLGLMFSLAGWFIEPYLRIGYATITYPRLGGQEFFYAVPGFHIGYQHIFDFGLLLNIGTGIEYEAYFPSQVQTNAWSPNFLLSVGYAF